VIGNCVPAGALAAAVVQGIVVSLQKFFVRLPSF
jgi:hypothetical protein